VQITVDRKEAKINMRVDPLIQLNEAITSVLEAIAYPSVLVLLALVLAVAVLELRSRRDRADALGRNARRRGNRVAPAS
jgi:hypothetical protein